MKNSEHRRNHLKKKAIKEAERAGYLAEDKQTNEEELRKHYHNPTKDAKSRFLSGKKRAKRQNTGVETGFKTEPDHIHFENERWTATVRKQTIERGKRLRDKLTRRKG